MGTVPSARPRSTNTSRMKSDVSFAGQLVTDTAPPIPKASIVMGMARTSVFGADRLEWDIVRPARTRYMKSELDGQGHHHGLAT